MKVSFSSTFAASRQPPARGGEAGREAGGEGTGGLRMANPQIARKGCERLGALQALLRPEMPGALARKRKFALEFGVNEDDGFGGQRVVLGHAERGHLDAPCEGRLRRRAAEGHERMGLEVGLSDCGGAGYAAARAWPHGDIRANLIGRGRGGRLGSAIVASGSGPECLEYVPKCCCAPLSFG